MTRLLVDKPTMAAVPTGVLPELRGLGNLQTVDLTTIALHAVQLVSHLPPILPDGPDPALGSLSIELWGPITAQLRMEGGDEHAVLLQDCVIPLQLGNSSFPKHHLLPELDIFLSPKFH